jgi:dolichol-phosphate mannosyltransferase
VGANLVRRLLDEGHVVHAVTRSRANAWRLHEVLPDIELHEATLTDRDATADIVRRAAPEWIFHLATYGAYPMQQDGALMVRTNVEGTTNLLQSAVSAGFDAFVNTGSSSEYGLKDHPADESEALEPNSDYAATKASATNLCAAMARERRLALCTLRLYSVYGPYEDPGRLMPRLIACGRHGTFPPLVDPRTARDFVEVSDVTRAYLLAAASAAREPGAVYNVGSGTQTTVAEAVDIARRTLGINAEPEWQSMPPRSWDTHTWVASVVKIREQLHWQPTRSVSEGFQAMVEWLIAHPRLWPRYRL